MFVPNLLRCWQERLGLPQVDDDVTPFHAQHFTRDDIALATGVLFEDDFPFRLPQPLQHHLLRSLRGDASSAPGCDLSIEDILQLRIRFQLLRLLNRQFRLGVGYLGHHRLARKDSGVARLRVDLDDHVVRRQVVPLVRR